MSNDGTPIAVTQREIAEVLRTFARSNWRSMTLEVGGLHLTVGKDGPPPAAPAAPPPATTRSLPAPAAPVWAAAPVPPARPVPPPADVDLIEVRSPAVGSFWVAPSPGAPPFVVVGQAVESDEQLAIVEVMKLMNPVVAPQSGEIVQVCAANADLVEYDQVLFRLRPIHGG